MKLRYLAEFVALADTGEFLGAARALGIGQASLSKHIRSLEAEFGVPLFLRTTRRVELSPYGAQILPFVRRMLEVEKAYTAQFEKERTRPARPLVIGLIHGLEQFRSTELLMGFRRENPHVRISILQMDSYDLARKVQEGSCDFAFVKELPAAVPDGFCRFPYAADTLCAVLPAQHALAGKGPIRLRQLAGENFLLLAEHGFMYDLCTGACRKAGFSPNVVFTGTSGSDIQNLVAAGLGVSLLMRTPAAAAQVPGTVLADLEPPITARINLIYIPDNLPPDANSFLQYCTEQARAFGLPGAAPGPAAG